MSEASTFFLENYLAFNDPNNQDWEHKWSNSGLVLPDTLDRCSLSGAVDLFYSIASSAWGEIGLPQNPTMPQRVEWTLFRTLKLSEDPLFTKYVVDFDGDLGYSGSAPSDWQEYKRLYFKYLGNDLMPNGGPWSYVVCLTNVIDDTPSYDGLNNIDENCWQTDSDLSGTGTATVRSQSLYPDGRYRIEITSYAHDGTDHVVSEDVVVHNFFPMLSWAHFSNSLTDQIYWDAGWEVVETTDGYEMEFVVNADESTIPTGQTVDVEIHFSETIDLNAPGGAPFIVLENEYGYRPQFSGTFSGTTTPNDTWTGSAILVPMLLPGRLTLLIGCQDMSGEWLEDPANPGIPCMDTYHGVDIAFGVEPGWPATVNDEVFGSPKLADIDLDGDLDVVIQCADGYVEVLDDDGIPISAGWPADGGWNPSTDPDVYASPAIINLYGVSSSAPEILAVHPYGCNGFMADGSAIDPWSAVFGSIFRWFVYCSPVAGDFTDNGSNEFVMGRQHRDAYPDPYIDINLMARTNSGSPLWITKWGEENYEESVCATPCLADVDNDGNLEVVALSDGKLFQTDVIGNVYCIDAASISQGDEKWVTNIGTGELNECAVVTGNLDGDLYLEIVVIETAGSNSIKVLDGLAGDEEYTRLISGTVKCGASIADIDGDGDNDFVVSTTAGMLYACDGPTGNDLSGFPVNLGTFTDDGVSIGDIDGDGMLELVIAGKDGKLHVINHDGSSTGGFPVTVSSNPLSGQPALGDIDGDGRLEILFGELNNSVVHCYEMADNSAYTYLPWPQFQHDAANTGYFPTDNTAPGAPSSLSETHTWHGDVVVANLSWALSPDDPGDVIGYRIYGQTPPDSPYLMTFVPASSTSVKLKLRVAGFYNLARFYVTAYDGVNESSASNDVRIPKPSLNNLAQGCPVREITHSAAIRTSSSSAAIGTSSTSAAIAIGTRSSNSPAIDEIEGRTNCGILTDGYYDAIYTRSSSSDCIEIDLGAVFTVSDVVVIRSDQELTESHRFELSIDGRSFSSADAGRARYVRVYNASGASEIEVIGTNSSEDSALIEIQRSTDNGYRIATVESGSPITATIFDLSGRSIWNSTSSIGEILWNRCNSSGNTVPSGVYLIMVESDDMETFTSKVIVR